MKKLLTMLFIMVACIGFVSAPAFADAGKGQKIFIKMMKKPCGFNGGVMAKKYTQAEWKEINDAGKLNDELLKQCPSAKPLNDRFVPPCLRFSL